MIAWGQLLSGIVGLITLVTGWLRDKQLITLGETKALADRLRNDANTISAASKARDNAVRAADAVHPSSKLPDDGFRRD